MWKFRFLFHLQLIVYHIFYISDEASSSPSSMADNTVRPGMNRSIPIGSSQIHCKPPASMRPQSDSGKIYGFRYSTGRLLVGTCINMRCLKNFGVQIGSVEYGISI